MRIKSTLLLFFFSSFFVFLPNAVDAAKSGKVVDESGAPVAGVAVSDGLSVVPTDAGGRFSLPDRAEARFIFISTPSGYKTVDKFYRRVEEPNAEGEYVFTLASYPASSGEVARFIQVSDVEQSSGDLQWLETIRRYVESTPTAFIISTGDICYANGLRFNAENFKESTTGAPTYFVNGNHDLVDGDYGEQLYESLFGPCWYSFNAGPVHFVGTPMPAGDRVPSYSKAKVAAWLKNDLALLPEGTPVVIFQHSSPGGKFDAPSSFKYDEVDLKSINLKGWFFGHYHTSVFYRHPESGIVFGSVAPPNKGGIDHSVASFYVYEIDKNGVRSIDKRNSFWNGERIEKPTLESDGAFLSSLVASVDLGGEIHFGAPVATDYGFVVGTADDGNREKCEVVAINADGSIRWRSPVENSIKAALATDGERVFATDQTWTTYAFDVGTGARVWSASNGASATSCMVAPIVFEGVVYAGQGKDLTAYDARSGEIRWRNSAWGGGEGTTAGLAIVDGKLLASANWSALYAHDLKTGELLWTAKNEGLRFRSSAPISLVDSKSEEETILAASHVYLQTLDPKTGELIKSEKVGTNLQTASTPVLYEGLVLVGSGENGLCAFDASSFERVWTIPTNPGLTTSSPYLKRGAKTVEATPLLVGSRVIFGGLDGVLRVVDLTNPTKPRVEQSVELGAPILAGATLAKDGKSICVADYSGRVLIFALQ